jgi:hypothetical protein
LKLLLRNTGTLQIKKKAKAGHWWLLPVILPTCEAEIRRVKVQGQFRQVVDFHL